METNPRDPSTLSGDWRMLNKHVGLEGPVVPSEDVLASLGKENY